MILFTKGQVYYGPLTPELLTVDVMIGKIALGVKKWKVKINSQHDQYTLIEIEYIVSDPMSFP